MRCSSGPGCDAGGVGGVMNPPVGQTLVVPQHETHLWLFFAPSDSSNASASAPGWMRCTGPCDMPAVVLLPWFTALTSAPLETRYLIMSTFPGGLQVRGDGWRRQR